MFRSNRWHPNLSRAASSGQLDCGTADVDQRGKVTNSSDDRSALAKAYQWSARIMVVAMEMVLPGLAGYWLDQRLGTVVLFMLLGFGFGCTAAVVHLTRMVQSEQMAGETKFDRGTKLGNKTKRHPPTK
jgi:F0F1-type ATP synthase assembly protein I